MRRPLRFMACAVVAVTLSGCWWAMPGSGPSRQAYNPAEEEVTIETVSLLEEAWVATTDDGAVADPVTSLSGVHVSDATSTYGFATATGERLWSYSLGENWSMDQPYVTDDQVWVSGIVTRDAVGPTVALDARSGAVVETLAPDQALAAVSGDHAAFWGTGITSTMDVLDRASSSWVCCGDLLFGAVAGRDRWPVTLGADTLYDSGVGLTHTSIDNIGNGIRAYQIDPPLPCSWIPIGMCPIWATPLDGTTSALPVLNAEETVVYVGTNAGTFYAVDAATGAVLWSAAVGSPITDSPALAAGRLYVPTESTGLVVFDESGCGAPTCTALWTGTASDSVSQQPAVAGGVVYTGMSDGNVAAFDAAGCQTAVCAPVWSASTGSPISGAPAISNGQVFVGTADGRLVAYGLP